MRLTAVRLVAEAAVRRNRGFLFALTVTRRHKRQFFENSILINVIASGPTSPTSSRSDCPPPYLPVLPLPATLLFRQRDPARNPEVSGDTRALRYRAGRRRC